MDRSWHVDDRKLWGWGDPDRRFEAEKRPGFFPFLAQQLGIAKFSERTPVPEEQIVLPAAKENFPFMEAITQVLQPDQVRSDSATRLRHSFGQGYHDLVRLRQGLVAWSPDLVVYPDTHDQVSALLQLAQQHDVCVIPFGGGTNIFGMLEAGSEERRLTVSLDTRKMARLLEVDVYSRTARFQSGVFGPDLEAQLKPFGLTLGHFPDSFSLSTLGGWLATRSAGMFSSRYGKIEDMVLGVRLATPSGEICTRPVPASSAGPDLTRLVVGSEGAVGVITEATLKVRPRPEIREFETWAFPDFASGVDALQSLAAHGHIPALVRLMDEHQVALMKALAPEASNTDQMFQKLGGLVLKTVGGMEKERMALLFLAHEGGRREVREERRRVSSLLKKNGGMHVGAAPAEKWFRDVFDFGMMRDVIYSLGILADAAETAATWSNVMSLYRSVPQKVRNYLKESGQQGFISGHVSHVYPQGASLYFIFALPEQPGGEIEQHREIRELITQTILEGGGTLSHHHGVGRALKPFLTQEYGQTGLQSLKSLKRSLDPSGILNPGSLLD